MSTLTFNTVLMSAAVCATAAALPVQGETRGPRRCQPVRFVMHTSVDFASFTAAGTVSGGLQGTVEYVGDGTSVRPVVGEILPPTRDTLSFSGEATFHTSRGRLTTRNVGVFQPGPFGSGVEVGTIIAGTGSFAGARGTISFAVSSDQTGTNFVEFGFGEICKPA